MDEFERTLQMFIGGCTEGRVRDARGIKGLAEELLILAPMMKEGKAVHEAREIEIATAKKALEDQEARLGERKDELARLESNLQRDRQQLEEGRQRSLEETNNGLANVNKIVSSVQIQVETVAKVLRQVDVDVKKLPRQEDVGTVANTLKEFSSTLKGLENRLDEEMRKIEQRYIGQVANGIDDLQKTANAIDETVRVTGKAVGQISADVASLTTVPNDIRLMAGPLGELLRAQAGKLDMLDTRCGEMLDVFQACYNRIQAASEKADSTSSTEITQLRIDLAGVRKELSESRAYSSKTKEQAAERHKRVQGLKKELADYKVEREREIVSSTTKIEGLERELASYKGRLKEVEREVAMSAEKITGLKKGLPESGTEIAGLEKDIDSSAAKVASVLCGQAENQHLREANDDLRSKLADAEQKAAQLEKANQVLDCRCVEQQVIIDALKEPEVKAGRKRRRTSSQPSEISQYVHEIAERLAGLHVDIKNETREVVGVLIDGLWKDERADNLSKLQSDGVVGRWYCLLDVYKRGIAASSWGDDHNCCHHGKTCDSIRVVMRDNQKSLDLKII